MSKEENKRWSLTFNQYFWYLLGYSRNYYESSDIEERKRYWKKLGDKYIGDNDNDNNKENS